MHRFKNRLRFFTAVFVAILMWLSPVLWAQETEKQELEVEPGEVFMKIGTVTVDAPGEARRDADLPGSVDVIGADVLEKEEADTALDLLRLAPGITIGDYNSGGVPNGFTLRGFGMGTHAKHTAVIIDGIPYNYHMGSADGAVDLNQLSAEDIERIAVVKGPIDPRYGNWSRAGIVHFYTRKRGNFVKAKTAYGSFDTQKAFLSVGKEHFENKFNQVYSLEYYDTDGYRDNSDYARQNAYGKWFYRPQSNVQVGLILHAYNADWHTAGYLPEYLWKQDPRQSIQEDDGGLKELQEAQLHLDWNVTESMPLEFKVWGVSEDYTRWADWGGGQTESHFEHKIYGTLGNLGWDKDLGLGGTIRLDGGYDYRYFDTTEENWDTTYRHRTNLNRDEDFVLEDLGFYAKANWDPFKALRLFGGARYDTFDGDSQDNQTGVEQDLIDYNVWTYAGGAIFTFLDYYSLYGNVGTSFQLPEGRAKYQIDSPDESDLLHYEFGFKVNPIEQVLLRYAYFRSKNDDEIRWVAGEYLHEGETIRKGHEVELNVMPLEGLECFGAYTYHEATYEEGDVDGNWVPSIPKYILKLGVDYRFPFGTGVTAWYRDVGKWYTTADNANSYEGYEVFDLKLYHSIADDWTVSLDVKNLFDEDYSEYVGYWTDPFGVPDNQYAASDGRYFQVTVKYQY